jgi:hypothetical protein
MLQLKKQVSSAQNALHEIQCTPQYAQYISSWTAATVGRLQGSCWCSDRQPLREGGVALHCQQELHTHKGCEVFPQRRV